MLHMSVVLQLYTKTVMFQIVLHILARVYRITIIHEYGNVQKTVLTQICRVAVIYEYGHVSLNHACVNTGLLCNASGHVSFSGNK